MLQKSGRLVLWEAMFILELHSAETQDTQKEPISSYLPWQYGVGAGTFSSVPSCVVARGKGLSVAAGATTISSIEGVIFSSSFNPHAVIKNTLPTTEITKKNFLILCSPKKYF